MSCSTSLSWFSQKLKFKFLSRISLPPRWSPSTSWLCHWSWLWAVFSPSSSPSLASLQSPGRWFEIFWQIQYLLLSWFLQDPCLLLTYSIFVVIDFLILLTGIISSVRLLFDIQVLVAIILIWLLIFALLMLHNIEACTTVGWIHWIFLNWCLNIQLKWKHDLLIP